MLALTVKENGSVLIGDHVVVKVVRVDGKKVVLGITAPKHVLILREKLARPFQIEGRCDRHFSQPNCGDCTKINTAVIATIPGPHRNGDEPLEH
ncbi:MAG TPA: hypothetical protein DEB39_09215 [Planctomycetaceae bacterium]|nr:hypothetical protein [Planctomycetaceae bacterium]